MFSVKSPATFAVALLFLLATVCAAACPEAIQPKTSCHSESEHESQDTLCLEKDFLTQKTLDDGFVLPVVSISLAVPGFASVARVHVQPRVPSLVNLRSVVLRI